MFASWGMRQDFKAFLRNGLPAGNTESEGSVLDPCQRRLNHLYFSQAGMAQIFEHFITFPFGGALFNIGVRWLVQIFVDFLQSSIQFTQAIPQPFFVSRHIHHFHFVFLHIRHFHYFRPPNRNDLIGTRSLCVQRTLG